MPDYRARFAAGQRVRVASADALEEFRRTWRLHNPLLPEQTQFAGTVQSVWRVTCYHGGDPLYELEGVPGVWHEGCLGPAGDLR